MKLYRAWLRLVGWLYGPAPTLAFDLIVLTAAGLAWKKRWRWRVMSTTDRRPVIPVDFAYIAWDAEFSAKAPREEGAPRCVLGVVAQPLGYEHLLFPNSEKAAYVLGIPERLAERVITANDGLSGEDAICLQENDPSAYQQLQSDRTFLARRLCRLRRVEFFPR